MNSPDEQLIEQQRIRKVYRQWHGGGAIAQYAWHRPEVLQVVAARSRIIAPLLAATVGADLSQAHIVDVGCGSGGFLRQLIDWGADPARLVGTEFQQDRLDHARSHTAPGVQWHLGGLDCVAAGSVDLVTAETVFSSILDPGLRRALAADMWRALKPGGWCMVFDFRYDNPRNPNVRKVARAEVQGYWPAARSHYKTMMLAPPIARRLARMPYLATELLTVLAPVLRSHFVYMACKPPA